MTKKKKKKNDPEMATSIDYCLLKKNTLTGKIIKICLKAL